MLIERPPHLYRLHIPEAIWRFDPAIAPDGEKQVYLTFDDGPIPEATPWVLDLLAERGIKATFFVVGDNVRKYPHIFARIKAEGHSFGNHTMHHVQSIHSSVDGYVGDVQLASGFVDSRLFRPPHGLLMPSHKRFLLNNGFTIVMHDLVTRDYSKHLSPDDVLLNVKKYVRPGSVVVFHDSLRSIDKLRTALPLAIDWLQQQGYVFKAIPMP